MSGRKYERRPFPRGDTKLPRPARPGGPRRAWDEGREWPPPAPPPEAQHLPFLSLTVSNVLEATSIQGAYWVRAEVTNSGNAPAFQPVVELFEQWVPKRPDAQIDATDYRRQGFKAIGRLDPRTTRSIKLMWGEIPIPGPLQYVRQWHPIDAARQALIFDRIFVGTVYDPLLDPRPSLNPILWPRFHIKVVRRTFSSFEVQGSMIPVPYLLEE